jgi:hypothetical protein
MLAVREGLVRETLRVLHRCGRERSECVALWSGRLDTSDLVDEVLHPAHDVGPHGYEINPDWMHRLWVDLSEQRRCLRAQVHTHPRGAFHSPTDDEFPAVHTPGFVSLVVPAFARPPIDVASVHASVVGPDGWLRSSFPKEIRVV